MGDIHTLKEKYSKIDETELVKIAKNKKSNAQEYLIRKYMYMIKSKASLYFIVGGSKEDIIQEGMIGIYKAIEDYDDSKRASFATFANLCVTRQIITAIKRANRKKHVPLNSYVSLNKLISDEGNNSLIDILEKEETINPEKLVISREQRKHIEKQVGKLLSSLELKVFFLYLEGLSYKDIADKLLINNKSVDNALQRIKNKLSKHLDIYD
ncbi:MAG: RNA polymerase sporulation sigma factor SigH [Bacillota bacterium]